jgi:branched-chain amino acid transport system permease protein
MLVVMVAIGGWGHYWGPIFGAAIFTAVPELLRRVQDAELLVFGAGMVLVMLFLPGGIASIVARLTRRRKAASAKQEKVARHGIA